MRRAACLVALAVLLATASAIDVRITMSLGTVGDSPRGVVRGSASSWRFEPASSGMSEELSKALAAADDGNELVTVYAAFRSGEGERISAASVPLCALKAAGFAETFTVHLDEHGAPFHVSYSAGSTDCDKDAYAGAVKFNSTVVARRSVNGPAPHEIARPRPGEPDKAKVETPFYMSPMFLMGVFFVVFILPMLSGQPEGGAAAGAQPARR